MAAVPLHLLSIFLLLQFPLLLQLVLLLLLSCSRILHQAVESAAAVSSGSNHLNSLNLKGFPPEANS